MKEERSDFSAAANPFAERLDDLAKAVRRRRLDAMLVFGEANIRSLTGLVCDNGCLVVRPGAADATAFITDFRYVPMAHRVAPWLRTVEPKKGQGLAGTAADILKKAGVKVARLGFERAISAGLYLKLQTLFRGALGKENLEVKLESLGDADMTAMVTEDEQMRRYKEMSRLYGQNFPIPDSFTLVLNRRNATVQALAEKDPEDETTKMICCQMYDLARMAAQPLEAEEITAFLDRSRKLLAMLVK